MRSSHHHRIGSGFAQSAGKALLTALLLLASTGVSCDGDAANTFRKEATDDIGEGVRTIFNGVIDGVIAAVETAGDDDEEAAQN